MRATTYKCDRCGEDIKYPDEQVWNIAVGIACEPDVVAHSIYSNCGAAQWCRSCTEEFRLVPRSPKLPGLPEPPPKFEDLVREIVREEIQDERKE